MVWRAEKDGWRHAFGVYDRLEDEEINTAGSVTVEAREKSRRKTTA